MAATFGMAAMTALSVATVAVTVAMFVTMFVFVAVSMATVMALLMIGVAAGVIPAMILAFWHRRLHAIVNADQPRLRSRPRRRYEMQRSSTISSLKTMSMKSLHHDAFMTESG